MTLWGSIPKKIYYSKGIYEINASYYGLPEEVGGEKDFGELPGHLPSYMRSPGKDRQFVHDNTKPISNPKLIGFAHSFGNTKAQERGVFVVESNGQYFPMEIEVYFETLKNVGPVDETNTLKADYVFITAERIVRLVRVGSDIHDKMSDYTAIQNKPKVKLKDIEIGRVYSTPAGSEAVFLGYVTTVEYVSTKRHRNHDVLDFKKVEHKRLSLWFEVYWDKTNKSYQEQLSRYMNSIYSYKIVKSPSYNQKLKFKIEVPKDIIQHISNMYAQKVEEDMKMARKAYASKPAFGHTPRIQLSKRETIPGTYSYQLFNKDYSKFFNMSLYGCHPSFGERLDLLEFARNK